MTSHGASCGSVEERVGVGHGGAQQVGPAAPGEDPGDGGGHRAHPAGALRSAARAARSSAAARAAVAMSPGELAGQHAVREEEDRGVGVLVGHLGAGGDEHVPRPLDRPGAQRDRTVERGRADALRRRSAAARRRGRSRSVADVGRARAPGALGGRHQPLDAVGGVRARGGRPVRTRPPRRRAPPGPGRASRPRRAPRRRRRRAPRSPRPGARRGGRRRRRAPPARAPRGPRAGSPGSPRRRCPERTRSCRNVTWSGPTVSSCACGRLVEVGHAHAEQRARPVDHGEVAPGGRRDDHRGPRVGATARRRGARTCAPARRAPGRARPGGSASTPSSVSSSSASGLPPVAASSRARASSDSRRPSEPASSAASASPRPVQRERRAARPSRRRRRLVADGQQDDDGVGGEPTGGEAQRLRRRRVQQVGVVDEHGDRPVLGRPAQQAEHGRADREPLAAGPGRQGEGRAERLGLRRGDRVQVVQDRAQELQQAAERHLLLGVDPGGAQHAHPRRRSPRPRRPRAARSCRSRPRRVSTSVPLSPTRAAATSVAMTWRSRSRPTSTHPSLGSGPGGSPDAIGCPAPTKVGARQIRHPKECTTMTETLPQRTIDPDKLMSFVFRAVDEVGATLNTALRRDGRQAGLLHRDGGRPPDHAGRAGRADRRPASTTPASG